MLKAILYLALITLVIVLIIIAIFFFTTYIIPANLEMVPVT